MPPMPPGDQRMDRSAPGGSTSQVEEEACPEPVRKPQHRSSSSTQHHNHHSGAGHSLFRQKTLDSETQESRDSTKEDSCHEPVDHCAAHRDHSHREEPHGGGEHRHRESRHRARDPDREQDHNECSRQRSRHKFKDAEGLAKKRNEAGDCNRDVDIRQ